MIKKIYFFVPVLLISLFICGCATTKKIKKNNEMKSNELKVMTYNIHAGKNVNGILNIKRIAEIINEQSPDIVALQEVDQNTLRSGNVDQPAELEKLTGMKVVYGPAITYQGGHFGNLLLTKLKINKKNIVPLPGKEKRSIIMVSLELNNSNVLFLASHFDYFDKNSRVYSAEIVNNLLIKESLEPAILAGDLNDIPASTTIDILNKSWINCTEGKTLKTYSTSKPDHQIDYVFVRPKNKWKVLKTEVINERIASDHFPVVVTLQLKN